MLVESLLCVAVVTSVTMATIHDPGAVADLQDQILDRVRRQSPGRPIFITLTDLNYMNYMITCALECLLLEPKAK